MRNDSFEFLEIRFVDITGAPKMMTVPLETKSNSLDDVALDSVFETGVNIDGSSVKGFTKIEDSDLVLMPDPASLFAVPYIERARKAGVMCYISKGGVPFEGDTRALLSNTLQKFNDQRLSVGPEPEFFLIHDEKPADEGKYADVYPSSSSSGLIKQFSVDLRTAGIPTKISHHEVGKGQYEIELQFADALRTADTVVTYRNLIKALALKRGIQATFMPKPFEKENGNGMHCHLSLWEGPENLFASGQVGEVSETALHFIAGLLEHAPALTAIVAPTINSYKRLVPGYEAPVYISWAKWNRSCLIRIPYFGDEAGARIEFRCPDPSCNPYLAFTAILVAGMEGIARKLDPPAPVEGINVYAMKKPELKAKEIVTLPTNLEQALNALEEDKIILKAFPEHIIREFLVAKWAEWQEYNTKVTDWEWGRYF
ncbi:MAG: glutamine synthetase family protein [Candidatus Heimdallarchaeota archaeon]